MASRRSITTTAAAAGALLTALCFVPSASASVEHPEHTPGAASDSPTAAGTGLRSAAAPVAGLKTVKPGLTADRSGLNAPKSSASGQNGSKSSASSASSASSKSYASSASSAGRLNLADTGSVDTTPYLVGGSAFLAMGAGLVVFSRRRSLLLG